MKKLLLLFCASVTLNANCQTVWGAGSANTVSDSIGRFAYAFGSPNGWSAVGVSSPAALWTRPMNGLTQGGYATGQPVIGSPSMNDGAALYDSDFLDNGGVQGAFGTGTCPSPHKGQLISPSFDLTGYTNEDLNAKLFLFYRRFSITELSVGFSSDGGATWSDFSIQQGVAVNATFNPAFITVPLTNVTSGVSNLTNCKVRLTFDGDYYFAMVDDISIEALCTPTTGTDVISSCIPYTWIDGNTYATNNNTATFVLPNAAGCDSTVTLNLTINASPQITAHSGNVHACGDVSASFGIVSAGNNTYQWYYDLVGGSDPGTINGSDTEINYTTDTMTVQQLITGNYNNYYVYCEVTNEFNCVSYSPNDTIWVNQLPVVTASSTATTVCAGTEITLTGGGAVSYTWSDGVIDNTAFVPSNTNTYTVTGIDANNCQNTATIDVTLNPMPSLTTTLINETISAAQIGATYQWLDCNNSNAVLPGETNQNYTATLNGSYAVEVSLNGCLDTSGCVAVNTVGIRNSSTNNSISVMPNPNQGTFTIKSSSNGAYTLVNELGQKIQSFELNNTNNNSASVSELAPGVYFVIGMDNSFRKKIVVTK